MRCSTIHTINATGSVRAVRPFDYWTTSTIRPVRLIGTDTIGMPETHCADRTDRSRSKAADHLSQLMPYDGEL